MNSAARTQPSSPIVFSAFEACRVRLCALYRAAPATDPSPPALTTELASLSDMLLLEGNGGTPDPHYRLRKMEDRCRLDNNSSRGVRYIAVRRSYVPYSHCHVCHDDRLKARITQKTQPKHATGVVVFQRASPGHASWYVHLTEYFRHFPVIKMGADDWESSQPVNAQGRRRATMHHDLTGIRLRPPIDAIISPNKVAACSAAQPSGPLGSESGSGSVGKSDGF
jgi:hypothetical protein